MRGRSQDIIFGVTGQSFVWDAPEGRPSAVTDVQVFEMGTGDSGTEEVATSGAAAIDAVNTTVDAASGLGQADPRKVNLTATSNIVAGRQYLLTDDDSGLSEWVHVLEVVSADYIIARDPLANAYSVGATFQGTRITIAVDATWVADTNNISDDQDVFAGYRIRWIYTVASLTRVWHSDADLVRYASQHSVLPADIEAKYPGFRQRLPALHQSDEGRRLIDQAHEDVRWDLVDVNLSAARVRAVDAINRATVLRFGMGMAESAVMAGRAELAALEHAARQYDSFMNRVFRAGPKVPVATEASGAGGQAPQNNFWRPR
jgi:hypothetical protein